MILLTGFPRTWLPFLHNQSREALGSSRLQTMERFSRYDQNLIYNVVDLIHHLLRFRFSDSALGMSL